jgi:hypothetical protein
MTISVAPGSLSVPTGKIPVGAGFEITGVGQHAPASIIVRLSKGTTVTAALSARVGGTAFYRVSFPAGTTVTGATATVPTTWTGQFTLVAYTFQATTGTGTGTGGTGTGGTGAGTGTSGTGTTVGAATGGTGTSASAAAGTGTTLTTTGTTSTTGAAGLTGLSGTTGSGFPAGATGLVAPTGDHGTSWPLIGFGLAGLLGAAALRTRARDGKATR